MLIIDKEKLADTVIESFENAKSNVSASNCTYHHKTQSFISNNIPCYDINKVKRGSYFVDSFVSFFADMRGSTKRIKDIGITKAFLTLHTIVPTMIYIIEKFNGSIVDVPGDGVMALFKDNKQYSLQNNNINAETIAVHTANEIFVALRDIVNPLLEQHDIPPVTFGIGIDSGEVIVTKVGTNELSDLKALGSSINNASKHSNGNNEVYISKRVYDNIPYNIKIDFKKSIEQDWYYKEMG